LVRKPIRDLHGSNDAQAVALQSHLGQLAAQRIAIPNPHRSSPRNSQASAVGAEVQAAGHATGSFRLSSQDADFLALLEVPDLQRPVVRVAGQTLAIGAKDQFADPLGVPMENKEQLANLRIPHRDHMSGVLIASAAISGGNSKELASPTRP
jgi:hypothetical protein